MNYRHSFHAGNSADVVKHGLLIALVRALQQKPGALTLIDTHAGCGLYDLDGEDAQRTGEAAQGVLRACADPNPLLDDYRAVVQAVNAGAEPHVYPGSPRILAQLLRAQDLLILNEKHPDDAETLRSVMRGMSAAVHERDAYELWLALLPPPRPGGGSRRPSAASSVDSASFDTSWSGTLAFAKSAPVRGDTAVTLGGVMSPVHE